MVARLSDDGGECEPSSGVTPAVQRLHDLIDEEHRAAAALSVPELAARIAQRLRDDPRWLLDLATHTLDSVVYQATLRRVHDLRTHALRQAVVIPPAAEGAGEADQPAAPPATPGFISLRSKGARATWAWWAQYRVWDGQTHRSLPTMLQAQVRKGQRFHTRRRLYHGGMERFLGEIAKGMDPTEEVSERYTAEALKEIHQRRFAPLRAFLAREQHDTHDTSDPSAAMPPDEA